MRFVRLKASFRIANEDGADAACDVDSGVGQCIIDALQAENSF